MAVNEEILLDIKVQNSDAISNIMKLEDANYKLRKSLADMEVEIIAGTKTEEDLNKARIIANAQIKENNAGIRENSKEIKTNAASVASASDSINGMRARVADLSVAWNSMSKSARESDAGKQIQKELLGLNESINASNKSIGNFKDNIGNYPTAQLGTLPGVFGEIQGKATSAFDAIKGKLEEGKNLQIAYKSSLERASEAQAEAKRLSLEAAKAEEILTIAKKSGTATSEMQATAEAARAAATKAATVATEASAAAMKILKIAIASTGIGILVVALGSLVAYFTKTNEGAKKFQQVMNGVNAVIQSGVKIMGSLGKLVVDVLTGNVKELSKDFDSVKNNIKGATTEISKNYEAAERNAKNQQMMAKREREWSGQRLVLLKEYEDARIMASKKSSLDDEGKIAAAKKAIAINNEIYANDLKIAKNKSIMVENEQKLVSKKDYQAIQDSKNKVQEIINAHSQQQLTISNLLGKAEQREEASNRASVKSNEQKLKEKQDQEIKSAEDLLKLKKTNQKDLDATLLTDPKYFKERISILEKNNEDEIAINKLKYKKNSDELKIANANSDKELASGKLALQKQLAEQSIKELDYELQLNKVQNETLLVGKKLTNEEIHKNKIAELKKTNTEELEKLRIQKDAGIIEEAEYNEQVALKNAEKNLKIAQDNADFEQSEKERKLQAQSDNYANELSLLQENSDRAVEIKKAQLDSQMAIELVAAKTNGANVELIQKKYAKSKKDIDKASAVARLDQEKRIADGVANLFGKTTKAGKIAASASTAIETYKGAQSAIAGMAGAGPVGWALGAIEAGVIIANGVKTIADINKTSETSETSVSASSSSSPSSSSGSTSASSSVYTNLPTISGMYGSNASQNETAQVIAQSTPTPVVSVTEITNMQNTVKVKENSKL